jgi:uncharacterized membrane-anchored protein
VTDRHDSRAKCTDFGPTLDTIGDMRMGAVLPGLASLTGDRPERPGLVGVARVDRNPENLVKRLREGQIAVVDQIDLDLVTAEALVDARVAGVVNAAPSISGRYPNQGPEALLYAGIELIDGCGPDILRAVRDGSRIRLFDGGVFHGEKLLGRGTPQTRESVASAMDQAKEALVNQLEAFSANTIEFMRQDRALLLDGVGVPEVRVNLQRRPVLVVAPGTDHVEDLARLNRYIRENRPVLVGVNAGGDALLAAGHKPDLLVGDPAEMSDRALMSGADVVVPAFADGHAPGLYRVQDLGTGAVTFPASGNPEDLALLLAHHHRAELIVTVGFRASLAEFLDRDRSGKNASTFLTRLKVNDLIVDGKSVARLHRSPVSAGVVALLIAAAVTVLVVAVAVTPAGPAILGHLQRLFEHLMLLVTGWFAR